MDTVNFDVSKLNEQQLAELITYHNRKYWEDAAPEISDDRYDELLRALKALNPEHPVLEFVGAPAVSGSGKVIHARPMLSLDKAYSLDEVMAWALKYIRSEDEELLIQPKYDGISANFDGRVLSTRGDGVTGEDISDKLPLVELETGDYRGPPDRPARGEIVIRNDDFRNLYSHIVKKGGGAYKNSRNAVAGIMGLKDIGDMLRQGARLTLVDYGKVSYRLPFRELKGRWHGIATEIEELPYPMDGIVIKLADADYGISLGSTAHHPRGQIAFKFSGIRRESKILDVKWSFGKNCLTPVAEIEPVEIGGITIRHATLHNLQNVEDKDIHAGDTVVVERAGDVIPYIVEAIPGKNRRSIMISECPGCGRPLERRGPELCCVNPDCFDTRLQRLCAAVRNIGIERLGEPNIRRMMTSLQVRTLKDIFELKKPEILQLEGFKDKSATNLLREIAAARDVNDYQLLAALNIPNVGINVAKMILDKYTLNELRNLTPEELDGINGVGPERAAAIHRELRSQSDLLDELLSAVRLRTTKGSAGNGLPKICFTGKMPEKRSYYQDLARKRGFDPVDDVTADLSLLVAEDPGGSSSKLVKARSHHIRIVGLNEWLGGDSSEPEAGESSGQLEFGF